jgi:hypothetical protein
VSDDERNRVALEWLRRVAADRAVLLGEQAFGEAEVLASEFDADADADYAESYPRAFAVGCFHWLRADALSGDQSRNERATAIRYLAAVHVVKPEYVPSIPRALFERENLDSGQLDADPSAITRHALEVIETHRRVHRLQVLDQAILLFRSAVDATTDGHPDRAWHLSDLSTALERRDRQSSDASTLAEAIRYGGLALAAAPANHPDIAAGTTRLGLLQLMLAQRTEDDGVLLASVETLRSALAAAPQDSPGRVFALNNLAEALRESSRPYQRPVDPAAAREAVRFMRQAVDATATTDPNRVGYRSNLGECLRTFAELTAHTDTMAEAVRIGTEAVALVARENLPLRMIALGRLMNAQSGLFQLTEETSLLREAAQIGREIVSTVPEWYPARARFLCNAAAPMYLVYCETGDVSFLREALDVWQKAVTACREGSPGLAKCQTNLGLACKELYDESGDRSMLRKAIFESLAAANSVSSDDPDYAGYHSNLGRLYVDLAGLITDDAALAEGTAREAVKAGRQAVAASSPERPKRVLHVLALGSSLEFLLRHTEDEEVRAEARYCFREVAESTTATVHQRIGAYERLAKLAAGPDEVQDRLRALESAVGLVGLLTQSRLPWKDREFRVDKLAGLANRAAEAALVAGQPSRAVELLEQTRGILTADTLGMRSNEQKRLRRQAPDLADRLDAVRARLDAAEPGDAPRAVTAAEFAGRAVRDDSVVEQIEDRRRAYAEWESLLVTIRGLTGFEDFLRPPTITELTVLAREEPIVIVTHGHLRTDALILTGVPEHPVRVVPLPLVNIEDVYVNAGRLAAACGSRAGRDLEPLRVEGNDQIPPILAWLWDVLAEPVLKALGHVRAPREGERWPRIHWCPVGVFGVLPLHAAGRHTGSDTSVMDRAVSSYTTTVRALVRARAADDVVGREGNTSTLVVSVPSLPGSPLPGAVIEAAAIGALIPEAQLLTDATRDAVLDALPTHQIAHFACHGRSDPNEPRRSHLVLLDHDVQPLTTTDISTLNVSGDLAYLSACDTATMTRRLADESLHLTSAFQLAGYRHVVGTLWPIDDMVAAEFATEFYTILTDGGSGAPRTEHSASALHRAARHLRERYPAEPWLWAAYTHTGA